MNLTFLPQCPAVGAKSEKPKDRAWPAGTSAEPSTLIHWHRALLLPEGQEQLSVTLQVLTGGRGALNS